MDTDTYEFYSAQCQTKGITPMDKKEWEKTRQKQDKQDNLSIRAAKKSITDHKKQLDDALNY